MSSLISNINRHIKSKNIDFGNEFGIEKIKFYFKDINLIKRKMEIKKIRNKIKNLLELKTFKEWIRNWIMITRLFNNEYSIMEFQRYLEKVTDSLRVYFDNEQYELRKNSDIPKTEYNFILSEYKKGNYKNCMAKARQFLLKDLNDNQDKTNVFKNLSKKSKIFLGIDNILKDISSIRHFIEKEIEDDTFDYQKEWLKKATCKFVIEIIESLRNVSKTLRLNENKT